MGWAGASDVGHHMHCDLQYFLFVRRITNRSLPSRVGQARSHGPHQWLGLGVGLLGRHAELGHLLGLRALGARARSNRWSICAGHHVDHRGHLCTRSHAHICLLERARTASVKQGVRAQSVAAIATNISRGQSLQRFHAANGLRRGLPRWRGGGHYLGRHLC